MRVVVAILCQTICHIEDGDLRFIQLEDLVAVLFSVPVAEQALGAVGGQEALHRVSIDHELAPRVGGVPQSVFERLQRQAHR